MSKIARGAILASIFLLLAAIMPACVAEDGSNQNATINQSINETNNATDNMIGDAIKADGEKIVIGNGRSSSSERVLRAGFEKTKAVNNLDVYGNRSEHAISSKASALAPFDISQRVGNVSQFTYNTDIYKPIYSVDEYRRTKPSYQTPESIANRQVYNISGYPTIKAANSIP
jgi:hypothetical protein